MKSSGPTMPPARSSLVSRSLWRMPSRGAGAVGGVIACAVMAAAPVLSVAGAIRAAAASSMAGGATFAIGPREDCGWDSGRIDAWRDVRPLAVRPARLLQPPRGGGWRRARVWLFVAQHLQWPHARRRPGHRRGDQPARHDYC